MPPKTRPLMQYREARLQTFEGTNQLGSKQKRYWIYDTPDKEQLADFGFFFTPSKKYHDQITCFVCNRKESNVEGVENIAQHHLNNHPNCPYSSIISRQVNHLTEEDPDFWSKQPDEFREPLSKKAVELRRKTFGSNWVYDDINGAKATSETLANAGFYFCPIDENNDRVQCVYCHCPLDTWDPQDDPIAEHLSNGADNCYFIEQFKADQRTPKKPRSRSSSVSKSKGRAKSANTSKDTSNQLFSDPIDNSGFDASTPVKKSPKPKSPKPKSPKPEAKEPASKGVLRTSKAKKIAADEDDQLKLLEETPLLSDYDDNEMTDEQYRTAESSSEEDEDEEKEDEKDEKDENQESEADNTISRRTRSSSRRSHVEKPVSEDDLSESSEEDAKTSLKRRLLSRASEEPQKRRKSSNASVTSLKKEPKSKSKRKSSRKADEFEEFFDLSASVTSRKSTPESGKRKVRSPSPEIKQSQESSLSDSFSNDKDDEEDDEEFAKNFYADSEEESVDTSFQETQSQRLDTSKVQGSSQADEASYRDQESQADGSSYQDQDSQSQFVEDSSFQETQEKIKVTKPPRKSKRKSLDSKKSQSKESFDEERFAQVLLAPKKSKKIKLDRVKTASPAPIFDISNQDIGNYDEKNLNFIENNVRSSGFIGNAPESKSKPSKTHKIDLSSESNYDPAAKVLDKIEASTVKKPTQDILPQSPSSPINSTEQVEESVIPETDQAEEKHPSPVQDSKSLPQIPSSPRNEEQEKSPSPPDVRADLAESDNEGDDTFDNRNEAESENNHGYKSSMTPIRAILPSDVSVSTDIGVSLSKSQTEFGQSNNANAEDHSEEVALDASIPGQDHEDDIRFIMNLNQELEESLKNLSDIADSEDDQHYDNVLENSIEKSKSESEKEEVEASVSSGSDETKESANVSGEDETKGSVNNSVQEEIKESDNGSAREEANRSVNGSFQEEPKINTVKSEPRVSIIRQPNFDKDEYSKYEKDGSFIVGVALPRSSPHRKSSESPVKSRENSMRSPLGLRESADKPRQARVRNSILSRETEATEPTTVDNGASRDYIKKETSSEPTGLEHLSKLKPNWVESHFTEIEDKLQNMQNACKYLEQVAQIPYSLKDDEDGQLTHFISTMPEEEEEMTIKQWIEHSASNCRKLVKEVCQEMIVQYKQQQQQALSVLEALPTVD